MGLCKDFKLSLDFVVYIDNNYSIVIKLQVYKSL